MTFLHCPCLKCRPRSPLASLPGWDIAETIAEQQYADELRKAFELMPKYTLRVSDERRDTVGEGR